MINAVGAHKVKKEDRWCVLITGHEEASSQQHLLLLGRCNAEQTVGNTLGQQNKMGFFKGEERKVNAPQLIPGFFVTRLMQGSLCSHRGSTRFPSSFDQDSFA